MLLGVLADRQLRLLEGGPIALVRLIEKRCRDLGGQVIYRSTVEEILVDDGKALGGRLSDDSEHRSDAVISAADRRSMVYGMLGGRHVDGKIESMYKNWENDSSDGHDQLWGGPRIPQWWHPPVSVHWPSCGADSLPPGGKTLQDNSPISRPVACGLPPQPQGIILRVA